MSLERTKFGPKTLAELPLESQLLEELSTVDRVTVEQGREIGYRILNQGAEGDPIISIGGFFGSLTTPDRTFEAVQAASLGVPILQLDLPGHGQSSRLDKEQIVDLTVRRQPDSFTAPMGQAISEIMGEDQPIRYVGYSQGGLMALLLAASEAEKNPRTLSVFAADIPGTMNIPTAQIQFNYIFRDGTVQKRKDDDARRVVGHDGALNEFKSQYWDTISSRLPEPGNFAADNKLAFFLNLFRSANAKAHAYPAIDEINKHSPDTRIGLLVGSESGISNATNLTKNRVDGHAKYDLEVLLHESHTGATSVHTLPRLFEKAAKHAGLPIS